MTDKVIPSTGGDSNGYIVARIIELAGGSVGWIQDSSEALLADNDTDLNQSAVPLGAFDATHAAGSLTVTIDTGEGFVGGAWVARDVTTDVTLAASTDDQDVYFGWDHNATDTMIIGLEADFEDQDPKKVIWTFDTDGSGVTNATDQRTISAGSAPGTDQNLGRFLMTAITQDAVGTPGDHTNELYRAAGLSSDALFDIENGSSHLNLTYNAYHDGSDWRYITANRFAYKMSFGSGRNTFSVAPNDQAADAIITWSSFNFDVNGDIISPNGTFLYDGADDEILKARLGGPASSLTSYPLPHGDIDDGPGSLLDADTVDGVHASEFSTDWTLIETQTDSDDTTEMILDFTISPTYDQYRAAIQHEAHPSGFVSEWMNIRLNNQSSNDYYMTYIDDEAGVDDDRDTWWKRIANTNFGRASYAEVIITCIKSGSLFTTLDENHPTIGILFDSSENQNDQLIKGEFQQDTSEINRLTFYSGASGSNHEAGGQVKLFGRNLT